MIRYNYKIICFYISYLVKSKYAHISFDRKL